MHQSLKLISPLCRGSAKVISFKGSKGQPQKGKEPAGDPTEGQVVLSLMNILTRVSEVNRILKEVVNAAHGL